MNATAVEQVTLLDGWATRVRNDLARISLEAQIKQWVERYEQLLEADYEFQMRHADKPMLMLMSMEPNPWPDRLKALVGLGRPLSDELASREPDRGVVWGADRFREAFAEADAECKAIDSLAKRSPLDWAKIMANLVPPSKEWFDREHELDAAGRVW